jgi:HSP20 family protein
LKKIILAGGGKIMTLVRWDPFKDVASLQDRINRLFSETFGRAGDLNDEMSLCAWRPAVDIYEAENGLVLIAELPGINKEAVSVEIKDNVLTLKGERHREPQIKEEHYYRQERCFGTFQRSFTLRERVRPELIKATFKDGVLKVEIPTLEEEKPKKVTVNVE